MANSIAVQAQTKFRFKRLLGYKNDLLYFYLPTLAVMTFFAVTRGIITLPDWILISFVFVNSFHQGGTLFHFLDKRNREYYCSKENRFRYIMFPLLTVVGGVTLALISPALLAFTYLAWGIQHLVQQNMGILLLYHDHKSGEAVVNRNLEVRTQHSACYLFSAVYFCRMYVKDSLPPYAVNAIIAAFCLFFLVSMVMYLWDLSSQLRRGASLNVSAFCFWLVTVFFLLPMTFANSQTAILLPSFLHWVQYIGINQLLVQRKYAQEKENTEFLPTKTNPLILHLAFCAVVASAILALNQFSSHIETANSFAMSVVMSISLYHYALDGKIWKFREQYNRQAILKYLIS